MTKKRKMERVRVSPNTLLAEKTLVSAFTMNFLRAAPGTKTAISDVFQCYRTWLGEMGLGDSKLSVDGFGRVFPKHFKRGTAMMDGGTRKCIFDVRVVE